MIAPPVERGLIAAAKEVAVIAEMSSTKLAPGKVLHTSPAIGNNAGITTPVVELTQERMPELAARIGAAVRSVMKEVRKSEIILMLPSVSMTFTRAPTPQIKISVPHGIPLMAAFFIGYTEKYKYRCCQESKKASVQLKTDTADNHDDDRTDRITLFSVKSRNFRKLQRILIRYLPAFVHNIHNTGEYKA